jgi:hypothetical protein
MVAFSVIVGAALLLNQFGLLINEIFGLEGELAEWFKVFVAPNQMFTLLGLGHVTVFFLAVSGLIAWKLKGTPVLKPFLLGLRDGFLATPTLCILAAILYALYCVLYILLVIIAWIATPIIWLFNNVIGPVVSFLAIPFNWLFDALVIPVVEFVSPPFVFFFRWVFIPIFGILLVSSCGGFALIPFSIVGRAFIRDVKTAWVDKPNPGEAYGKGVMLGLIFWLAVIPMILETRGLLVYQPSAAVLFGLVLGALFAVRLSRPATGSNQFMLQVENRDESSAAILRKYWLAQSGLAVVINSTLGVGGLILKGIGISEDVNGNEVSNVSEEISLDF